MTKKSINIDSTVLKASKKHKLPLKQTMLLDATIKNALSDNKKTNAQLYIENIAKSKDKPKAIASKDYNAIVKTPKFEKALNEVLEDNNINKKTIIQTHKEILNESLADKQYTVSRNCNRDFMELEGMLKKKEEKDDGNLYINNAIIDLNAIDKLLKLKK